MAKIADLLNQRFRKKEKPKMTALAEQTSEGRLSSFSGIFGTAPLGDLEREKLSEILDKYAPETAVDTAEDLDDLIALTSEVKAINNQAAILHGERIKRAQQILKKYREGAFTTWLLVTYGNRQTPYNFLQYYEFYETMPKTLHPKIEEMPRQAVYTLASRKGTQEKKEEIVRNYHGETKEKLLAHIRSLFPLDIRDGRREDFGETTIAGLRRLVSLLQTHHPHMTIQQKASIKRLIGELRCALDECKILE